MSNTDDYIITTMSGGLTQRTFKTTYSPSAGEDVANAQTAPFQISFPGVPSIRGAWKPYYVVPDGDPPATIAIPDSEPAPILADNLYHWWKFDDGGGTGTEAANSGVSPNKDTMLHNAVENVSLGNRNGKIDCINLTGKGDLSFTRQIVTQGGTGNPYTPMGSEWYLASGSLDQFTFSMWAKITGSLPSNLGVLWGFARNENLDDGAGMYYDPDGSSAGTVGLHFWCGGTGAAYTRVSSVATPPVGQWFHVACVLDVTGGIHKAYLNGTAGANFDPSPGAYLPPQKLDSAINSRSFLSVGLQAAQHVDQPFHNFPVSVSDMRWYNVALTDAQVQEIANGDWP